MIKDFKVARYNLWLEDLNAKAKDNGLQLRLEKPLLRRQEGDNSTTGGGGGGGGGSKAMGEIVCNFDEDLISLFSEVTYWEKFQGTL